MPEKDTYRRFEIHSNCLCSTPCHSDERRQGWESVRTGDRGSEPRLRIKIGNLDRQSGLVIWAGILDR